MNVRNDPQRQTCVIITLHFGIDFTCFVSETPTDTKLWISRERCRCRARWALPNRQFVKNLVFKLWKSEKSVFRNLKTLYYTIFKYLHVWKSSASSAHWKNKNQWLSTRSRVSRSFVSVGVSDTKPVKSTPKWKIIITQVWHCGLFRTFMLCNIC